ncbi:multifunctional acyl-CoA thioesterase I/protease I/lysophospholipase L1 [Morganella morganii subsp. morganii]|uniref:multifunctional acyl-CoA thioesterase I/protease I/lysophospholipase L1 n=1 Tax=Morganella morganii TaxID=582 RepID=UPI000C7C71D8|nr:multifunctional acyl-CoA thioesterase I/protease I/lysophospholipase L1 [Morganella morganii]ELA8471599.1 multifunctional acyl-CoA thioesterase I/protease I/lysophospholipase L1 [Morganella morganii]MBA5854142.1 multifunctional acyl-CoA thioesterase I/protease I/lysophospholipase L1 [Morganella morganii]MBC3974768.1 multifunctional acyl-CoA thioesterase I/protease I/lysophospholipase L1 [Morganella morganii]MBT0445670.1 multifunctional acyl-CoA thioesterase I/protease I/lysophospholipase L1 
MINFKNRLRCHLCFLFLLLFSGNLYAAGTLLILGDSLSAGYRLPAGEAWAAQLGQRWQQAGNGITLTNGSISGNTAAQGLARLPALLEQHRPQWVLIELGANDGLRGLPLTQTRTDLQAAIDAVKAAGAKPLLMQIRIPPNYGKRYTERFSALYPALAQENAVPLIPFYMEAVVTNPQWIQDDGIHPNAAAQPYVTDWMDKTLLPYLQ